MVDLLKVEVVSGCRANELCVFKERRHCFVIRLSFAPTEQ